MIRRTWNVESFSRAKRLGPHHSEIVPAILPFILLFVVLVILSPSHVVGRQEQPPVKKNTPAGQETGQETGKETGKEADPSAVSSLVAPKSEQKEKEDNSSAGSDELFKESDGETGSTGDQAMPKMPGVDTLSFIKSLMALCFVLGMIFLAAYFFKRITGMKTSLFGGMGKKRVSIEMVGNMPLGDKKYLAVVQIQDKHYFIGITQESINLLSPLELDLTSLEEEQEGPGFESFFKKAGALLNRNRELK